MKAAEDNFNRIEQENMSARQLAEELRTDVVKKQNEIIREKKEQDKLRKEIEGVTKETEDLEKKLAQSEKRLTDHRASTKDQERLLREQKSDIEKKNRENKIMSERINKLKQEYDLQIFENDKMTHSNNETKKMLQMKELETNERKAEIAKVKKEKVGCPLDSLKINPN